MKLTPLAASVTTTSRGPGVGDGSVNERQLLGTTGFDGNDAFHSSS